jgi:hypothetical protein
MSAAGFVTRCTVISDGMLMSDYQAGGCQARAAMLLLL